MDDCELSIAVVAFNQIMEIETELVDCCRSVGSTDVGVAGLFWHVDTTF